MKTYTQYQTDWQALTQNSSTSNVTLGKTLINDHIRELATKFYFNEKTYTAATVSQQQGYAVPTDFEVIEDVTVLVGGYLWQATCAPSRKFFDQINLIPYYNDYPQYYYIWNGQINLWPIPSSAGNTITVNYKSRVVDLGQADINTGTVSVTTSTTAITGAGTSFASWMGQSGWLRVDHTTGITTANGDYRWYQIGSVTSATVLNLSNSYLGATVAAGTFTIGDVPILPEDYQDMPLYRALYIYYNSIVVDVNRAKMYKAMYDARYEELSAKYGSKDYSPVLVDINTGVYNPNLFPRNLSQA